MSIRSKVSKEVARQRTLGYTLEHDQRVGTKHLVYWAFRYFLKGKLIKGLAIMQAARAASWQTRLDEYK